MEATLKFNLPEEEPELQTALNAEKWKSVCFDMNEYFYRLKKNNLSEAERKIYNECHNKLLDLMNDRNTSFD